MDLEQALAGSLNLNNPLNGEGRDVIVYQSSVTFDIDSVSEPHSTNQLLEQDMANDDRVWPELSSHEGYDNNSIISRETQAHIIPLHGRQLATSSPATGEIQNQSSEGEPWTHDTHMESDYLVDLEQTLAGSLEQTLIERHTGFLLNSFDWDYYGIKLIKPKYSQRPAQAS